MLIVLSIALLFYHMLDTIILESPLLMDVKRNGKENNKNKKPLPEEVLRQLEKFNTIYSS